MTKLLYVRALYLRSVEAGIRCGTVSGIERVCMIVKSDSVAKPELVSSSLDFAKLYDYASAGDSDSGNISCPSVMSGSKANSLSHI